MYVPGAHARFQKSARSKCVYDWADPGNKWKLVCATHEDSHPCIIVLDWLGRGSGTMLDLLEESMLTGEALKDATKVAEENQF